MLLTQKHLTVVATVNFHARINEYEVSALHPSFDTPTETINDWTVYNDL